MRRMLPLALALSLSVVLAVPAAAAPPTRSSDLDARATTWYANVLDDSSVGLHVHVGVILLIERTETVAADGTVTTTERSLLEVSQYGDTVDQYGQHTGYWFGNYVAQTDVPPSVGSISESTTHASASAGPLALRCQYGSCAGMPSSITVTASWGPAGNGTRTTTRDASNSAEGSRLLTTTTETLRPAVLTIGISAADGSLYVPPLVGESSLWSFERSQKAWAS